MGLFDRKKKAKDLITPLPPPNALNEPPYLGPPPVAPPSVAGTHYGSPRPSQAFVPVSTSRPKSRQLAPGRPSTDVVGGGQQTWERQQNVEQQQQQQRRPTAGGLVDGLGGGHHGQQRDDGRRPPGQWPATSAADDWVRPLSFFSPLGLLFLTPARAGAVRRG